MAKHAWGRIAVLVFALSLGTAVCAQDVYIPPLADIPQAADVRHTPTPPKDVAEDAPTAQPDGDAPTITVEEFKKALSDRVPAWETVNEQPEFIRWLQAVDPGAGNSRKVLINEAAANLDADMAASYFERFIAETNVLPDETALLAKDVAIIPIHNTITDEITVPFVEKEMRGALRRKVRVIVIDLDTPGGEVMALYALRPLLKEAGDSTSMVAYVNGAEYGGTLSAGIDLAFSCHRILMAPGTVTGAAMVVNTRGGASAPKFQSAEAAESRAVAERNGHPPEVAEAMTLVHTMLYVIEDGAKPRFFNSVGYGNLPANERAKATILKKSGQILTLTAEEATRLQIASLCAEDDLATMLGITDEQEQRRFYKSRGKAIRRAASAITSYNDAVVVINDGRTRLTAMTDDIAYRLHPDHIKGDAGLMESLKATATKCEAISKLGADLLRYAEEYPSLNNHMDDVKKVTDCARTFAGRLNHAFELETVRGRGYVARSYKGRDEWEYLYKDLVHTYGIKAFK